MKHREIFVAAHVSTCSKYTHHLCVDADIMSLQHAFVTPGLHSFKVPNMNHGRSIMMTILQSLNCYTNIACLSTCDQPLRPQFFDVYYALMLGGYVQKNFENSLDMFFLEQFDVNFLWIELTQDLSDQPWFYIFERKLDEYNIGYTVPIITMITE